MNLINLFKKIKNKKVVLFGAGGMGSSVLEILPVDISYFVDNNYKIINKSSVKNPKVLLEENIEDIFIVVTSTYYSSIKTQLIKMGFKENVNFANGCAIYELVTFTINKDKNESEFDKIYHDIYNKDSLENKRFYNIGAGRFRHKYWTNIDHFSEHYKNNFIDEDYKYIEYDILSLDKINCDDNSAEVIYTSHTIEHVNDEADLSLFRNVYRMLKKGGYFRITTIDIDLLYNAYKRNDLNFYYECNDNYTDWSIEQLFLSEFAGQLSLITNAKCKKVDDNQLRNIFNTMDYEDALNYLVELCDLDVQRSDAGNHMNWFNKNKICKMLKDVGFTKVYVSSYGQSLCPILRDVNYFDNTCTKLSLYIEAIK